MTSKTETQLSKRVEQHGAMLKEALAHPSVREVMEVYGAWQQIDERLGTYRATTMATPRITTTDQANTR